MKRYRLYIDESGDHTYGQIDNMSYRYLCLLGLVVEVEKYRAEFYPDLEKLKQVHFPHNPDEPIILHRKELRDRTGPFWRLKEPRNQISFNTELLQFLSKQDYTIIGVTIDKKSHIERYDKAAYHPYHYCLVALMERYCGYLNFYNAQGDVLAESRGRTEDGELKASYTELLKTGTQFRAVTFFTNALTSKEIKLKPKMANIAGLQIADLLAYPVKQEILVEQQRILDPNDAFDKDIRRVIASKYNHQIYEGRIYGYGKVFLA